MGLATRQGVAGVGLRRVRGRRVRRVPARLRAERRRVRARGGARVVSFDAVAGAPGNTGALADGFQPLSDASGTVKHFATVLRRHVRVSTDTASGQQKGQRLCEVRRVLGRVCLGPRALRR